MRVVLINEMYVRIDSVGTAVRNCSTIMQVLVSNTIRSPNRPRCRSNAGNGQLPIAVQKDRIAYRWVRLTA